MKCDLDRWTVRWVEALLDCQIQRANSASPWLPVALLRGCGWNLMLLDVSADDLNSGTEQTLSQSVDDAGLKVWWLSVHTWGMFVAFRVYQKHKYFMMFLGVARLCIHAWCFWTHLGIYSTVETLQHLHLLQSSVLLSIDFLMKWGTGKRICGLSMSTLTSCLFC